MKFSLRTDNKVALGSIFSSDQAAVLRGIQWTDHVSTQVARRCENSGHVNGPGLTGRSAHKSSNCEVIA